MRAGGASEWTAADIDTLRTNATFAAGSRLGIDTSSGSFGYGASVTGAPGILKLGGNTLTLSAANTHTGGTTVCAGTLIAANADAPSARKTQYFEMFGNRGIYHEGWYACTTPPTPP